MTDVQITEDKFGVLPDSENPKDPSKAQNIRRFTLANKSGTKIQVYIQKLVLTNLKYLVYNKQ